MHKQDVYIEKPTAHLTKPLLFLSSETRNWGDDLILRAYHEPSELYEWAVPSVPQTGLVILSQGTMLLERQASTHTWQSVTIQRGDLFLTPGGGSAYKSSWHSLSPEPMQTIHLLLQPSLLARVAEEVADTDPHLLTLAPRIGFQDPLLTQIGFTLWRELLEGKAAGRLYAETAAQLLAIHLLRHYCSPEKTIPEVVHGLTQRHLNRVTDFVLNHLHQDLSLEQLAREAGFSPYHFARLFRQRTGQSPHQFVVQKRIEKVRQLLQETDTPLVEIALASGFANQSHLTQVFKRACGLTPHAYRQQKASFCLTMR
jgi:AraC family transcriptional regulator